MLRVLWSATNKGTKNANATGTSNTVAVGNARVAESHGAVPASPASQNANSKSKRKWGIVRSSSGGSMELVLQKNIIS